MKVKNQYLKILSFNKWPSIQYTFWVSLVLWNHNNGEHCWLGNGPERLLTPSTKKISHRGSLLKGAAVQGVLYQSILNAKLTGRKKLGRKMCTSNRDDRKLENTVKQSWLNTWESFTRSELKPPSHFWNRNSVRSILPGLRRKYLDCFLVVQSPLFRWK